MTKHPINYGYWINQIQELVFFKNQQLEVGNVFCHEGEWYEVLEIGKWNFTDVRKIEKLMPLVEGF